MSKRLKFPCIKSQYQGFHNMQTISKTPVEDSNTTVVIRKCDWCGGESETTELTKEVMNQPNQSELDEILVRYGEYALLKDANKFDFAEMEREFPDESNLEQTKQAIMDYITANYTANSEVERLVCEARVEELTSLLSMQRNKPRRVLLKDAANIAYTRVCELTKEQPNDPA